MEHHEYSELKAASAPTHVTGKPMLDGGIMRINLMAWGIHNNTSSQQIRLPPGLGLPSINLVDIQQRFAGPTLCCDPQGSS